MSIFDNKLYQMVKGSSERVQEKKHKEQAQAVVQKHATVQTPVKVQNPMGVHVPVMAQASVNIPRIATAMEDKLLKARHPSLSEPCTFDSEEFGDDLKATDVDNQFVKNNLYVQFRVENTETGATQALSLDIRKSKDGKEIGYYIGTAPVIIKPITEKYKTFKGCVSALFSAARYGDVLSYSDTEIWIISGVEACVRGGCFVYAASLCDK